MASESPKLVPFSELLSKIAVSSEDTREYIMVSEDRASTVFHEWKDRIRSKSAWHTPLALVVTIAATLATTTFKDQSWIKGATLKGAFITALVVCFFWLAREIHKAYVSPSASASNFIADLKKGTKKFGLSSEQ